jgi:hypothetical protein
MGPAYILLKRGYEKPVPSYDAVWDLRKLVEEGFYRDTQTLVTQVQTQTAGTNPIARNETGATGVAVNISLEGMPVIPLTTITPTVQGDSDEITHTPPRQLAWRSSMLTFTLGSAAPKTVSSVSTGADTLTCVAHGLAGKRVSVSSSGELPAPLLLAVAYFVVNPTADTVQLAYTQDGPAIDLTTVGSGVITLIPQEIVSETRWADVTSWSLGQTRRIS